MLRRLIWINSQKTESNLPAGGEMPPPYMNTHYAETLFVGKLAANAHMSPNSFFAHFRHATGTSPIQYLLKLRVMHASDHLLHTDWSMDEIARRNGFTDANYMSRVFRAVTGRSPSALRRL